MVKGLEFARRPGLNSGKVGTKDVYYKRNKMGYYIFQIWIKNGKWSKSKKLQPAVCSFI